MASLRFSLEEFLPAYQLLATFGVDFFLNKGNEYQGWNSLYPSSSFKVLPIGPV